MPKQRNYSSHGNNNETNEEILDAVDSVLIALDELDDIIADNSNAVQLEEIVTEHGGEVDDNHGDEELKEKIGRLVQEREYEKKKNEQLEIIVKAQEALLVCKTEEIMDLTDIKNAQEDGMKDTPNKYINSQETTEQLVNLTKTVKEKEEEIKERDRCITELRRQVEYIEEIKVLAEESRK